MSTDKLIDMPAGPPEPRRLSHFTTKADCGCKRAVASGFFGDVDHILTYTPREMPFPLTAFITARKLTTFRRHGFWIRYLLWTVFCLAVALLFRFVPVLNDIAKEFEEMTMRQVPVVRTVAAFVVGGYTLRCVAGWTERRRNYAGLCGTVRNLVLNLATLLPDDEGPAPWRPGEVAATRSTLGRWIILTHELAVLKARGKMDDDRARDYLEGVGLLVGDEWERMVPGDRHTTVEFWIQNAFKGLVARGLASREELIVIAGAVSVMRAQANDLMSSLDRDLPYPYAMTVKNLVDVTLFFVNLSDGLHIAVGYNGHAAWKWVVQLFFTQVNNYAWGALVEMQETLYNPFGHRIIDVAHETIHKGLRTLAEGLLGGKYEAPRIVS